MPKKNVTSQGAEPVTCRLESWRAIAIHYTTSSASWITNYKMSQYTRWSVCLWRFRLKIDFCVGSYSVMSQTESINCDKRRRHFWWIYWLHWFPKWKAIGWYCFSDFFKQWGDWEAWSDCSVTCGTGVQERTRECESSDFWLCQGRPLDRRLCGETDCPSNMSVLFPKC